MGVRAGRPAVRAAQTVSSLLYCVGLVVICFLICVCRCVPLAGAGEVVVSKRVWSLVSVHLLSIIGNSSFCVVFVGSVLDCVRGVLNKRSCCVVSVLFASPVSSEVCIIEPISCSCVGGRGVYWRSFVLCSRRYKQPTIATTTR